MDKRTYIAKKFSVIFQCLEDIKRVMLDIPSLHVYLSMQAEMFSYLADFQDRLMDMLHTYKEGEEVKNEG